jgi:hypothetical protein
VKMRMILLIAVCFSVITANAQTEAVKIPVEVKPFVEDGAKPIALESADLNGDGLKDYILVLERENPTEKDEYDYPKNQRPLLILVRGTDNKLTEAKRNETIVMCSACGGMMGDPFTGVTVGKNTFTVSHYGGSAWRWTADYKFNYSRIDKTWQLVRIEKTSFHAVDQNKTLKRKIMTPPKDFGKVDIADFDPSAFDETEKGTLQKVDVGGFNLAIEKAAKAGEAWVKMPTQVVARMIRTFSDMRSRMIEMSAPGSESTDSLNVTVIDDGFLDDSVRGEKHRFELNIDEQGVWKFVSAEKSWRCWEGHGHRDFSVVKCL